jgi:predicted DNA binding protein
MMCNDEKFKVFIDNITLNVSKISGIPKRMLDLTPYQRETIHDMYLTGFFDRKRKPTKAMIKE